MIEVNALGVVHSGAAVATGGVSLLAEGLANRVLGDSGCAQQAAERAVEEPLETIDSENE